MVGGSQFRLRRPVGVELGCGFSVGMGSYHVRVGFRLGF